MVFHYSIFNHGFKYHDSVFDGCHDLLIQWVNISNIGISTVKSGGYRCITHDISKYDAISLVKNSVLHDRGHT